MKKITVNKTRILTAAAALVAVFSLAGCGSNAVQEIPRSAETSRSEEATPETAAPEATATPAPTPVDRTAGFPHEIEASKLAGYGFAVTSTETVEYQYTGWQNIDGATYYYDPATHQPVTGNQVIQGNVYTFGADGALNRTARGIDVSKFQGSIDWNAVKADGITFAIIRCGYRGYGSGALVEDSTYRANIRGAINAGLKVGVYFYSQATNEAEAVEEASMVLSLVSGYSLPLGVYYDTEKVAGDTPPSAPPAPSHSARPSATPATLPVCTPMQAGSTTR